MKPMPDSEKTPPKKWQWPTLEGRLNQPFASRGEALLQMRNNGDILSPWAEKELERWLKKNDNKKNIKASRCKNPSKKRSGNCDRDGKNSN